MTDIERIARHVWETGLREEDPHWDELNDSTRYIYRSEATLVIESALLEPSDELVEAAAEAYSPSIVTITAREKMRAALKAAALAILGRDGSAG